MQLAKGRQETGEGRHHWPIVSPIETFPLGGGATKNEKSYHGKGAWAAWDCQN